ncbi:hypothetical protein [Accumulibacter sp.]|uniref:hypothetical protein n=1 Tax=Accumulibacter sp. TaxID=2053492 RepID=UPI0028C495DC|nr:hypothetical protein [Accumulibacter sp.]
MRTVTIECHIGKSSDTFETPSGFLGDVSFLRDHFFAGSDGVINLVPRNRIPEGPIVGAQAQVVDALDLHFAVERLAANPPGATRVSRVALILANSYRPRKSVFGVMFDRGQPTKDDPNDALEFTATPREGCAIFVDAIQRLRHDPIEFDKEVEFTTVHELGHLFNLDHLESPPSFMATSLVTRSHNFDHFQFTHGQHGWLAECATNRWVYPGGSPFVPVSAENTPCRRPVVHSEAPKVDLRIGIENAVFACAAPVEMDVTLSSAADSAHVLRIPDRLDPGYEEFIVWITYPNGNRCRYRSPRRYCSPQVKLTLKPGQSIARDISIFAGAGGTTFATPGIYHLRAEFDLGTRGRVVSNEIVVEAVANRRLLTPERMALLLDPSVRSLLYHRRDKGGRNILPLLRHHLQADPQGVGANDIRYALVRTLYGRGMRATEAQAVRDDIELIWSIPGTLGRRQLHHLQTMHQKSIRDSKRPEP